MNKRYVSSFTLPWSTVGRRPPQARGKIPDSKQSSSRPRRQSYVDRWPRRSEGFPYCFRQHAVSTPDVHTTEVIALYTVLVYYLNTQIFVARDKRLISSNDSFCFAKSCVSSINSLVIYITS